MARMMRRRARSGTTIVESAVMVPVLMMVIFGSLEFGSVFYMRHTMMHAAREATRTLAVEDGTVAQAEQVARDLLPDSEGLVFVITATAPPQGAANGEARVEIALPAHQAAMGDFFGFFSGKTVRVESTMRSED